MTTLPYLSGSDPNATLNLTLRLRPGTLPETLAFIDKTWRAFSPTTAVQRHFLDDSFDKLYQADERQGAMFGVFVGIAIFIACLGLFGLAAFTAGRRTKEIGIRKVFGARTRDVVLLLLWQFSIPVLIANLIAWPVAWYYLHDWLQGFAYRITLSPLYFAGRGPGGAADRLGHRLRPCPARRPRQSHPRPALRVGAAMFRNYLDHRAAQHRPAQALQLHQYRRPDGGADLRDLHHPVRARRAFL